MLLLSAGLFAALAGCSDHPGGPDAPHGDTGVDSRCGADLFYTGEYVDWDSNDTQFLGIFNAAWSVEGDATRISHTAPNGRFELCLAHANGTLVDATPDVTAGSNKDYLPGVVVVEQAVVASGVITSTRSFTSARRDTLFQQIGEAYDSTKGQLFVHLTNTTATLSISGAHAATQAYTNPTWAAGDTGTYVFFPNITLAGGTVTLTASTPVSGAGTIPLTAGKLTYVEVAAP